MVGIRRFRLDSLYIGRNSSSLRSSQRAQLEGLTRVSHFVVGKRTSLRSCSLAQTSRGEIIAKPKKKTKKGRKPPLTEERPRKNFEHGRWTQRNDPDPELTKIVKELDWVAKRCYMAYDWDAGKACVIVQEGLDSEVFRYFEFSLTESYGSHLLCGKEIQDILKKVKKAGRRRRLL